MKTKNFEYITLILTILFAVLYIFLANKYVSNKEETSSYLDDYDTYKAKIVEITQVYDDTFNLGDSPMGGKLIIFNAKVLNGDLKNEIVSVSQEINPFFAIQPPEISLGDKILISQAYVNMDIDSPADWSMLEYQRTDTIMVLFLIFFICLLIFGRFKGFLTMISLIVTCSCVFFIFIPAILGGHNIYFWSMQICIFIIISTLLIVNGYNIKSLSASVGCICGICTASFLTLFMSNILHLTGLIDEESVYLQLLNIEKPIDLKALIFSCIIIGAVGAIMDVAISIASSLNEIKENTPDISFKSLFISGLTIGRDIMGTMTNTLILAYIGSSLSTILLLIGNTSSIEYLLNTEMIIIEILQSLIGSMGILLTLPLTSLISAYLYTLKNKSTKASD